METQRVVGSEDGAGARRATQRRADGKRTIYGDSPGERAHTPSAGTKPDGAGAKPEGADDAVDAFWRDALDSIN
jgi:hypothetical protein